MMPLKRHNLAAVLLLLLGGYTSAQAAIAPDRTRLVFRGEDKSISVDLKNSSTLPYLAQSWVEDEKGNKIASPLTAVPPVQRIEPSGTGQVKIQGMPALASLAQDRETLFYYNVREIPPQSDKPNTLQIALQTRIKIFYRPQALSKIDMQHPWQYQITLNRQGDSYQVVNPTRYYVVLSNASDRPDGMPAKGFSAIVLAPNGSSPLNVRAADLGATPVLTYVNDYGARLPLVFNCRGVACTVDEQKSRKS